MIVIISYRGDVHLPYVTRYLKKHTYVIVDAYEVIHYNSLGFSIIGGKTAVFYRGRELSDVSGVWVRRPSHPDLMELPVEERYEAYARSALKFHLKQLFTAFPDALWISDEYAINRASTKSLQLHLASRLSFKVPETLFTSSDIEAKEFLRQHGEVIAKPQGTIFPKNSYDQDQVFFAKRMLYSNQISFEGLELAPIILQELVDADFDIRVTVVGEKVFAAKIVLRNIRDNLTQRDWRLGYVEGDLSIQAFKLPKDVSKKCVKLTKLLGLNFGAIDLVQDKKGGIWFLEINPNGQWAFIEDETGQPIGRTIATLLQQGNTQL